MRWYISLHIIHIGMVLYNIARIMAGFDFTIVDYTIDEGKRIIKQAIEYYKTNSNECINKETILAIRRYIKCRYDQMTNDAIKWHHVTPVIFTGDVISFSFHETTVSGIVSVSPKRIAITMKEPYNGPHDEVRFKTSSRQIFTLDLVEGSPANSEGIAYAQKLLERLYFSVYLRRFTCCDYVPITIV